ncbi:hypothetical protein IE81DRAFT_332735 [Ceraceosorus guamensis]|uniref:Uncharacterized protein n=1 Tax=Ceraceosorus guamensis TaxID=1522189 RepID=A0A316VMR0_9BASI|nr:hypothetical protein IE81DRAFT_332735 [Ceraceosorus guamensis]PWN38872.1 hypothetical protein IE81DRAFT_332735 [Ceraceosorus guamensis]
MRLFIAILVSFVALQAAILAPAVVALPSSIFEPRADWHDPHNDAELVQKAREQLKLATGPVHSPKHAPTTYLQQLQADYVSQITGPESTSPEHSRTVLYSEALISLNSTLLGFVDILGSLDRYFSHSDAEEIMADFYPEVYTSYAAALTTPEIKKQVAEKNVGLQLQSGTAVLWQAWDHAFLALRDKT